jgi:choline monooxygenase
LIGDEAATGDRYREAREEIFAMWDALNREDLDAVERLQKGRRSPAYDGGRLSPHWESPTHQLGAHVIDVILR